MNKKTIGIWFGLVFLLLQFSFGCQSREDQTKEENRRYNNDLLRGFGGQDTSMHGVTLPKIH
jgi:hypothetical protein